MTDARDIVEDPSAIIDRFLIERAKDADTIASLRKQLEDARSEALEEAAKIVDSQPDNGISFQALWRIAAAIRSLKGKS